MMAATRNVIIENVKKMLFRRGYNAAAVHDHANGGPHKSIAHCLIYDGVAAVYFIEGVKVNIEIIKSIVSTNNNNNNGVKKFILVYDKSLTPDAKNATTINNVFAFELFHYDEMAFDIYDIIDAHELYDGEAFKERNKLPIILATDRVARYYAFKKGDIVIVRYGDDDIELRRCV